MKSFKVLTLSLSMMISFGVMAQVQTVSLEQTKGKFSTESLSLETGLYQFDIANNNVGHDVGFVLVPKGKYDATDHIQAAYVTAPVANGSSSKTSYVQLAAGEYEYFCPMNPTPKYALTVHEAIETVSLTQTPKAFAQESVVLSEGAYQFDIANDGVGHDVGFVLVPKGKYDPTDHIKAAYVTAPVATGKSSVTKVVNLEAGEYEYFCPMNPTPKYTLMVKENVSTINLDQVAGDFKVKGLTLSPGSYQFEIGNQDVDHEVGFVLVPKGKYDATSHIKAAYVTSPVPTGSTSKTGIVDLTAGEYEYFCPLNPTPKYSITVK